MVNKDSRSIEEQIELLENRGMQFIDKSKAKTYLSRISYYRLKGYWWDLQKDRIKHEFNKGIYFEDIIHYYYFDKELRLILFSAIESIEIALRTKLIYHLSQGYGGTFHFNPDLFTNKEHHNNSLKELNSEFLRSNENFAKDFKRKYGIKGEDKKYFRLTEDPDAWIIFEVATFGTLSKMYKNLNHQLPEKSIIAQEFGLNLHNELSSWLEAISYLRNIIAHHSRIWNRNMVKRPMELKNPRNNWLIKPLTEIQQKKPYNIIVSMIYLCNAIGEGEEFKKKLLAFLNENSKLSISNMGFTEKWQDEPIWL